MALSLTSSVADVGGTLAFQTSATAAIDTLKGSSGTLYKVEIDNTANSVAVFVKLYNNGGGAPTAGSTDPNFVFKCAASSTIAYSCPSGTAFENIRYLRDNSRDCWDCFTKPRSRRHLSNPIHLKD